MKKYLLFLVAAMLATVARAYNGETFTYQGLRFTVTSETDHTVEVGQQNRYISGDISIPSFAVNGSSRYFVTSIGEMAFYQCGSLTSVTIPESVTSIGYQAFCECGSLPSVTIPGSVTSIGKFAFLSCSSLTTVTIPASVTEIVEGAFEDCSSLTEIIVENGNQNYTSESGVLFNIDKTELIQCPGGKTDTYEIPESVTSIGGYAFSGCSSLTSVTIPESVTSIGEVAFKGCSSLTSVTIPESVTEIGIYTFWNCSSLTSITIPESVTSIGGGAFQSCSSLTSVTIPESVTEIGGSAFYGCSSLPSVTIPESVTEIKAYTFQNCENLKTIYDLNPTPQTVRSNAFDGVPDDAVVYIPKGSFNKYFVANGWTHFIDFREMGALDVALSEQTLELPSGSHATITATVTKDDDVSVTSETWSSSNTAVATVEDGVVTAVAPGEAVIRFTVIDGYGIPHTESCKVTVTRAPVSVESISLDRTQIAAVEGEEIQLTATVLPADADNKEIEWTSSDDAVAIVSAGGLVKVLKAGSCVITAASVDGSGVKAECIIDVTSGIDDILTDASSTVEVFTLQGIVVLRGATAAELKTLAPGLYIVRQGKNVKKIAVK